MPLKIYNTLTGQKEDFTPLTPGVVKMYVCGVTVYDYCHVGHARSAIVFDVIYRYLRHLGYNVTYARNFTDIDDKIINRAAEEKIPWQEVTAKYIRAFYEDMGALNILPPTLEPKATEHIGGMTAMIAKLIANGKAYALDGDVYYSIRAFAPYGCLSGKNIEDLMAGARVEVDSRKRDPLDFALWKKSKPGEPFWDSPWGPGRPGWHIECSAMGTTLLGGQFDLHGGGKDLVFPHHENEIAQTQGVTGCPPVKYWVHNGFVNINQEKMSKSLGNFFTLRDIYKQCRPEVLRLFLLTAHYRSPIDFSLQSVEDAGKMLRRFYDFLAAADAELAKMPNGGKAAPGAAGSHPLTQKFAAAMDDDFNTALALAHMNDELRQLNKALGDLAGGATEGRQQDFIRGCQAMRQAGGILGLFTRGAAQFKEEELRQKIAELDIDVEKIEALVAARNAARHGKDWKKADECRQALANLGVVLEDTAQGTVWKIK